MKDKLACSFYKSSIKKTVLSIAGIVLISAAIFIFASACGPHTFSTELIAEKSESALHVTSQVTQTATPSHVITPHAAPSSNTPTPLPTPAPHPGDRDGKFLSGDIYVDDTTYKSDDLSIEITMVQTELVTYYLADVYYRYNANYFSAFSYGVDDDRIQVTSGILKDSNGIFAVSGDYYNARNYGLIIRNGILYRKHSSTEIMAVFDDGCMKTYPVKGISADEFLAEGALHTYSFGPALLENGEAVKCYEDRTRAYLRKQQPRCAVGMIEPYHYIFLVADGRSPGYSEGLTMEELSEIMYSLGCREAYNLDGGGSATMVFMGTLINRPQGRTNQRKVADAIVFKEVD